MPKKSHGKFLVSLSRNWAAPWPNCHLHYWKTCSSSGYVHISEELPGIPPCLLSAQHWAETPPGVPVAPHPRSANLLDYSPYI